MENACTTAADEPFRSTRRIHGEARAAFTLVELMVVIVIIGLITAVAVPVVMQALTKARNAAIKAEIDMLHMAIMNYRNEYGSFPPCVDELYGGPDGTSPADQYTATGEAAKHLKRLFPRCADVPFQLNQASAGDPSRTTRTNPDLIWLEYFRLRKWGGTIPPNKDLQLIPHTALVSWLGGFSSDPSLPLTGPSRKRLYDFDRSRVSSDPAPRNLYAPSGKPNAPYIYIDSAHYNVFDYAGGSIPGAERLVPSGNFFNSDSFQIICAGRDETYGTDDDLSNFWPGTRQEYLDSL
jgi:prepilin-type N-terminal cleavage/methylation domain-containing protein